MTIIDLLNNALDSMIDSLYDSVKENALFFFYTITIDFESAQKDIIGEAIPHLVALGIVAFWAGSVVEDMTEKIDIKEDKVKELDIKEDKVKELDIKEDKVKELDTEKIIEDLNNSDVLYEEQEFYNIFEDSCVDEIYLFSKGIEFFFTKYLNGDISYVFLLISFLFLLFILLFNKFFVSFKPNIILSIMVSFCCFINLIFCFKFNFIISVCIVFSVYIIILAFLYHNWHSFYFSKREGFSIGLILICNICITLLIIYFINFY